MLVARIAAGRAGPFAARCRSTATGRPKCAIHDGTPIACRRAMRSELDLLTDLIGARAP
jgi:hypothetical protein